MNPLDSLTVQLNAVNSQLLGLKREVAELQRNFAACKPTTEQEHWRCAVTLASLLPQDGEFILAVENAITYTAKLRQATLQCSSDYLRTSLLECCSVAFLDDYQRVWDTIVTRYIVYHTNHAHAAQQANDANQTMFHLAQWCKHFNYGSVFEALATVFHKCHDQSRPQYLILAQELRSRAQQTPCSKYVPRCGCGKRFWETCPCTMHEYSPPAELLLLGLTTP